MAKVQFFDNTQVFGYTNFQRYEFFSGDDKRALLTYGGSDFDADDYPFRIQLTLKDARSYKIESGENRGQTLYTGGEITKASFYTRTWDKLLEISEISASLPYFSARLSADGLFEFYDYLVAGGSSFFGVGDVKTGRGDDDVRSGEGDSFIKDLGGSDKYTGGSGWDTVTYDEWYWRPIGAVIGVKADLEKGTIRGPDGYLDRVASIDEIRGSFLDDILRGDDGDERLVGMQGDDKLNGRNGFDLAVYSRDERQGGTDRVKVDLKTGEARDGFGGIDSLYKIEGAIGTNRRDKLFGDNNDNFFAGLDGNDVFKLYQGDDVVEGGAGNDKFRFYGNKFGTDTIQDFQKGDKIEVVKAKKLSKLEISQDGDDAIIKHNKNSEVVLEDYAAKDLSGSDFLF